MRQVGLTNLSEDESAVMAVADLASLDSVDGGGAAPILSCPIENLVIRVTIIQMIMTRTTTKNNKKNFTLTSIIFSAIINNANDDIGPIITSIALSPPHSSTPQLLRTKTTTPNNNSNNHHDYKTNNTVQLLSLCRPGKAGLDLLLTIAGLLRRGIHCLPP